MEREKIMNLPCEKVNMEPSRYRMLFSVDSIYGVFRNKKETGIATASSDYRLAYVKSHDCLTPYDVLKDILFLYHSAAIKIYRNDIICIRINGYVWSYRFLGIKDSNIERFIRNFVEMKNFMAKEKECFINMIHNKNKVLSVLDDCLYDIKDIAHTYNSFYAIEHEHFVEGRNGYIFSDCFLYMLDGNTIISKNFYGKPFYMMKNALYYFMKERQGRKPAILLLNREELEMVADYNLLERMIV